MILFSVMTNASVGRLFLAASCPASRSASAPASTVWYAVRHRIASGAWDVSEMLRTSREVVWTLGAPVVIFGGIYGGS